MDLRKSYLLSIIFLCIHASEYAPKDRIHQRGIESLVFTRDGMTTGRRVSPRPQMKWTNPRNDIPKEDLPSTIHATNTGWDGNQVIWKFESELPNYLRLDQAEVQCEEYSKAGDPEVLVGSCGVVYSLKVVGRIPGKEEPRGLQGPPRIQGTFSEDVRYHRSESEFHNWVFIAFIGSIIALIACDYVTDKRHWVTIITKYSEDETIIVDSPVRRRRRTRVGLAPPSAPVYVSPTPMTTVIHEDRGSNFVSGYMMGSAMSSRPSTSTTNHHYHNDPARSSSPDSSNDSSWFGGGGSSSWGGSSSSSGGGGKSSCGSKETSTSKTFGGTTSL